MNAKPETAPYRAAFAPAGTLAEKRREAFARFEKLGFPTRREEAWRFTYLRLLQAEVFLPHPKPLKPAQREGEGAISPYFLAGDTSYDEKLMLAGKLDGVSADERVSSATLDAIRHFVQSRPTVYLPTHDPQAAARLASRQLASAAA